jgi:hypothetical protein
MTSIQVGKTYVIHWRATREFTPFHRIILVSIVEDVTVIGDSLEHHIKNMRLSKHSYDWVELTDLVKALL